MDQNQMLDDLCQMVMKGEMDEVKNLSQDALDAGMDPLDILEKGISRGMEAVGDRFESGEAFLPELIMAADTFTNAMEVISPALEASQSNVKKLGKVLMATVKGDVHNLGKNIVTMVLETNGFEVVDIGVDQPTLTIIEEAQRNKVDVIGLSAVMTTTMPYQKELISTLKELGLRDQFIIMVGGGPVNQEWADAIGADGFGATAMHAVSIASQKIKEKAAGV